MSDSLLEYRKAKFEEWVRDQIDSWLYEYSAWDNMFGYDDFDGEDWDFIKSNLRVANITIEEIGE